ncbi:hypothetical protein D3C87_1582210 [compost metagenome]
MVSDKSKRGIITIIVFPILIPHTNHVRPRQSHLTELLQILEHIRLLVLNRLKSPQDHRGLCPCRCLAWTESAVRVTGHQVGSHGYRHIGVIGFIQSALVILSHRHKRIRRIGQGLLEVFVLGRKSRGHPLCQFSARQRCVWIEAVRII